ncbi:hypothetical protein Q8A67_000809 [Cirrhinus molitorella]|uniref:Uncharacterized protein n=1 Tax=Cirrhinus molitorella TaxID=172907 RepID=A0AA88U0I3_9TELE|nr:hypothetical protein Q8A67_000809 [Cirrhinus molitorella]
MASVHSNCPVKQTMISSSLVLLLAVISCIDSYELTQPESLTVRPDATLTINCKVSYSVTNFKIKRSSLFLLVSNHDLLISLVVAAVGSCFSCPLC